MVVGIHDLDQAAGAAPQLPEPLDRLRVGAGRRRQDTITPLEELCETRLRARMLGSRNRMGRDEMNAFRQHRADIANDRRLDRADIGHDRAGLQPGRHRRRDIGKYAERRAKDDQIGVGHRVGRRLMGAIDETEARCRLHSFRSPGGPGDMADQPVPFCHPGERRSDQAEADQRHAFENGAVAHDDFRCAATASTTAFTSDSRPTVMRRLSGRP